MPDMSPIILEHYWLLARRGNLVALGLYAVFLAVFLALGNWPMALTTCAFLATLGWARSRMPWRHAECLFTFIWITVLAFSALAIRGVGREAGFHYYALTLLFLGNPEGRDTLMAKFFPPILIIGFYLGLVPWLGSMAPWWPLPTASMHVVVKLNEAALCIFIATTAFHHNKAIATMTRRLLGMASTDPLTGLMNRRRMEELAALVQNSHERHQRPFTVILGDIDHFKAINDRHGHYGGDQALKSVSECLLGSIRAEDQVARWGGEEFLILLPETTLEAGVEAAERIRSHLAQLEISYEGSLIPLTMTFGLSQGGPTGSFAQALGRADEALYRGKAAGRNRVERA